MLRSIRQNKIFCYKIKYFSYHFCIFKLVFVLISKKIYKKKFFKLKIQNKITKKI